MSYSMNVKNGANVFEAKKGSENGTEWLKACNGSFTGEAAAVAIRRPSRLTVAAPVFHSAIYGEEYAAKAISLTNQGDSDITIERMSLEGEGADYFTLNQTGSVIVLANGENAGYTICPCANADVGTYTADLVAIYDGGKQASSQVSFTVSPALQNAPMLPSVQEKTMDSITLEGIGDNVNGAKAQYSKDGGNTWQDSPVFSGLAPDTAYAFAIRYGGTKNYTPSPASAVTEITTEKKDSPEEKDPSEDIVSPDTPDQEERQKINNVIYQIAQIGEMDGSEISKQKIENARTAFERLTEEQKKQIPKSIEMILLQAEVIRAKKPEIKKIQIPDQVKINGVRYKVASVAESAFSGNKKAVSATIGKNVKRIGKEAFRGCTRLKKVFFKSKNLTKIGKNAFRGIAKSVQIKVPKKKYAVYKKLLAKKGLAGCF